MAVVHILAPCHQSGTAGGYFFDGFLLQNGIFTEQPDRNFHRKRCDIYIFSEK